MLAPTKLNKLEKQLNELQSRTTRRNLSLDEIKELIELAENEVKKLPVAVRSMVTLEYKPHTVAGRYGYRAEGTNLEIQFSKTGNAVNVTVERSQVVNMTTERLVMSEQKLADYIRKELEVEPNTKLIAFTLKAFGFNSTHATKQVSL